ncbi:DUF433 domain-containing protein [Pseudonocardia sp. CA-107938]|uniref:DUF433 domain-containing protein n=1 Tax=Pseudonocardia sp. CA-107938 TaxID=3240021 RepID=UPI003D944D4E
MATTPSVSEWPTYTYPQVDKLLSLSGGTARRWINGYVRNRKIYPPIVRPEPLQTSWVTWGEFLEARLMASYRDIDNVPVQHIRLVVESLRERTNDPHPLTKFSTYIKPHGRQLLFEAQGPASDAETFRFVERLSDGQLALTPWVRDFVDAVVDSEVSDDLIGGIRPDLDFHDIVCVAARRGGRPTIVGRNVLARTIAQLVRGGEAPEDVAEWYDITVDQVQQAENYVSAHPQAA